MRYKRETILSARYKRAQLVSIEYKNLNYFITAVCKGSPIYTIYS